MIKESIQMNTSESNEEKSVIEFNESEPRLKLSSLGRDTDNSETHEIDQK